MIILGRKFVHIKAGRWEYPLPCNSRVVLCLNAHHWHAHLSGEQGADGYGSAPEAAILALLESAGEQLSEFQQESMHRDALERVMVRTLNALEDLCKSK